METVIVEHSFPDRAFDVGRYDEAQRQNEWRLKAHSVRHVVSYLTPDRTRMVCVFEAPDAETLRRVAQQLDYGYDRIWTATVIY